MTVERVPPPHAILETGVVAIIRGSYDTATLVEVGTTLAAAGVSAIEVAANSAGAVEGIGALGEVAGVTVGAGTVLSRTAAEQLVAAGARFLVSPHVDPELIAWAAAEGLPILPGAFTATEVLLAWRSGASAVKLFPASLSSGAQLGPAYLAALRAPLDDVAFVPTGGVSADNAAAFVAEGAVAVATSSWLVPEQAAAVSHETLAQRAALLLQAVADGRVQRLERAAGAEVTP